MNAYTYSMPKPMIKFKSVNFVFRIYFSSQFINIVTNIFPFLRLVIICIQKHF